MDGDIGGRLRRAREHRGLSLRDAARRTKLSVPVIQAIERNDFARLPGGMFRKAYVRTLAIEVGLDPDEMAAGYCARFEPAIEPPPVPDRGVVLHDALVKQLTPSPQRSIVALLIVAAPAAVWFMLQPATAVPNGALPDTPIELVASPIPSRAGSTVVADLTREATPAAIDTRTADPPVRIELAATGRCWVVADSDGERVMYRLMEAGEQVVLEGQRTISLRLGDAGSVTLSINGGTRRSPGGDGEVVDLEVTPDNAEDLGDVVVGPIATGLAV